MLPGSPMTELVPDLIHSEEELDDFLTRPRAKLVEFMRELPSPLVICGAGGKMGPTLAVLARFSIYPFCVVKNPSWCLHATASGQNSSWRLRQAYITRSAPIW